MDAKFSHLLGDIRQPVLVIGDDPDTEGNVLVAALQPAQSVPAANVYDSPVSSPTDTVDGEGKAEGAGAGGTADTSPVGAGAEGEAATSSPDAAQPTAPSGDSGDYADNGDGTWTRKADGARGHFGPDGFVESGGETVTGVHWGDGGNS